MTRYDIFLAVAYKPACVEHSAYRKAIEALLAQAGAAGMSVYCAPAAEDWGKNRPPRKQAIAQDHTALRHCVCFAYFSGGFASDGALVELGMALALGRRILVLRWTSESLPSHVSGFVKIGRASEFVIDSDTPNADWYEFLAFGQRLV